MKKKGKQKSTTGIGANLTPDHRDKEESSSYNSLSCKIGMTAQLHSMYNASDAHNPLCTSGVPMCKPRYNIVNYARTQLSNVLKQLNVCMLEPIVIRAN